MRRTDTLRMIELEAQRDAIATRAHATGNRHPLDAWHEVHGAELDALHAMETADAGAGLPALALMLRTDLKPGRMGD